MDGVYNRKLFAKKATEARDKLREMGGVQPMMQQPPMDPRMAGIMASSPELMQAAMRRQVVLPPSDRPMMGGPQPMPQAPMLPPSQPIPNIAGIPQQPMPQQQAPRPMAPAQQQRPMAPAPQQPQPARFVEGGDVRGRFGPPKDFQSAVNFGQQAITSEDPASLGVPVELAGQLKKVAQKDPNEVANALANTLPEKEKTGSVTGDLKKILKQRGIEQIPVEAEIDELNKAIAGATLGAAIAGNYVNPNTGQELRPTAGARISSAVAQGLAVQRETETRRAEQEAALAKARIAAAAGGTKPAKLTPAQEELVKLFGERAKTEDPSAVAEKFNQEFGPGVGDFALQFYRTGAGLGPSTTTTTEESSDSGVSVGTTATLTDGSIVEWTGSEWRPIK